MRYPFCRTSCLWLSVLLFVAFGLSDRHVAETVRQGNQTNESDQKSGIRQMNQTTCCLIPLSDSLSDSLVRFPNFSVSPDYMHACNEAGGYPDQATLLTPFTCISLWAATQLVFSVCVFLQLLFLQKRDGQHTGKKPRFRNSRLQKKLAWSLPQNARADYMFWALQPQQDSQAVQKNKIQMNLLAHPYTYILPPIYDRGNREWHAALSKWEWHAALCKLTQTHLFIQLRNIHCPHRFEMLACAWQQSKCAKTSFIRDKKSEH